MKPSLELPKTIRTPNDDEIPDSSKDSTYNRLKQRNYANIFEGFKIFPKDKNSEHSDLPFKFYSEININNSKLWDLFINLCDELPNEVSLIFNDSEVEPYYGNYTDKKKTLTFLKKYKKEIVSDPFIEIGIIFHSEHELIEVFIHESKYIKFWGVEQNSFISIMKKFSLNEINELEFVDEYPNVRESLRFFEDDVTEPNELMNILKKEFT